jgi:hypothetical protein
VTSIIGSPSKIQVIVGFAGYIRSAKLSSANVYRSRPVRADDIAQDIVWIVLLVLLFILVG